MPIKEMSDDAEQAEPFPGDDRRCDLAKLRSRVFNRIGQSGTTSVESLGEMGGEAPCASGMIWKQNSIPAQW